MFLLGESFVGVAEMVGGGKERAKLQGRPGKATSVNDRSGAR